MPTIRGAEQGSKKRYAGLIREGDSERMVFKGLESVRPTGRHWRSSFSRNSTAGYFIVSPGKSTSAQP